VKFFVHKRRPQSGGGGIICRCPLRTKVYFKCGRPNFTAKIVGFFVSYDVRTSKRVEVEHLQTWSREYIFAGAFMDRPLWLSQSSFQIYSAPITLLLNIKFNLLTTKIK